MKKIISILTAGLMALAAVSCVQETLAVFDASKATAPVISDYQLTDDGVSATFTPGVLNQDFNQKMTLNHWLLLTAVNGNPVDVALTTSVKDNVISVTTANLSKALIALGYEEGTKVSLEMVIRASMQEQARDNGRNGYVESQGKIQIAEYEIFLPTGDPYARYTEKSAWSLIGSFNGWADDYEMWTNGTLHVAKGVELEAGAEVKFRKDAGWDVNFGYADGVESYTLGEEFDLGQGGANIVIAEAGKYDFILDADGAKAKIIKSVAQQEDPYAAYTETSPWSVIGSFNSWAGDVEMVTNGTLHVCKNITLAAGDEFKFRKDAGWDVNFGYADGVESYTLGEEFAVGQGGANIIIAEDGAYDLFLDPENATAKIIKTQAVVLDPYAAYTEASPWSVIGSFNSWGGDVEMVSNGTLHVCKAIALNAGDEWKFRKDADWTVNYGYVKGSGTQYVLGEDFEVAQDGDNIIIAEDGVYDLILDPENATAKVIASVAVEQPEPPTPVVKPEAWSLIGTLSGSSWDKDFDLTNVSGDIWKIRSVVVTAKDEFKIRADHDWAKSVGGPEENSTSTIDETNPYGVFKPELGVAFEAKDKNIQIGKDGLFDVTFDYAANTILIEEHIPAWSLIGMINDTQWNTDFVMTEKDGVWTSPVVKINGGFKLRYDYSWDNDDNICGIEPGTEVTVGKPMTLVHPGGDITLPEGNYKVQFTPATLECLITEVKYPEALYMVGADFGGWNWSDDGVVELIPVLHNPDWNANAEGQFWTIRYFKAGNGFKFNSHRDWDGGQFGALETNEGFTNDNDGNVQVPADGLYMVHIDFKRSILHLEPARIYAVGATVGDGAWAEGLAEGLFKNEGAKASFTVQRAGELRMYAASEISTSDCWTREFIILDGKIEYRGNGGDQTRVNVLKDQVVTLDFNAGTGTITGEGETPAPTGFGDYIYAIGGDTGWTACYALRSSQEGGVNTGKYKGFGYLSQEFKFKPNENDWNGDWEFDGEGKIADNGGSNCPGPEGSYYMIEVDLTAMTYTLTPITTIGIVGPAQAGGWDSDTDMAYNPQTGAWEVTVTLSAGEMKFRANDDWGINWGGAADALTQGGGNLTVDAGTYKISLFAWCDGKAYATISAQ